MLEMIFSFSIFLIIAAFLPLCFKAVFQEEPLRMNRHKMEWEVFVNQLKEEVRQSDEILVFSNKLIVRKNGDDVIYERYGTNLRRRVNFAGHEVVLQNMKSATFSPIPNGFILNVEDTYQETYQVAVRSFLQLEGGG
jgi:competence protein ComGF